MRGNPNNFNNQMQPNTHMMNPHNPHAMQQQQMIQHQQQQMMHQQMLQQQKMAQQQQMMQQQQMVQQQMAEQREAERRMKQLQRLQNKQAELVMGNQGVDLKGLELPRLTKTVAEEFIALNLGVNPAQLNFVKVPEVFDTMRHACMHGGVQTMGSTSLYYGTTQIKAGVCKFCGTVHYHYDMEIPVPTMY